MRERTRVVRFREERREFTPSEEDMGARNEFKDPSGDELSFFLSTPFHSLSLSLSIEIETRQEYEPPVSPDIRFRVIGNTRRRR